MDLAGVRMVQEIMGVYGDAARVRRAARGTAHPSSDDGEHLHPEM